MDEYGFERPDDFDYGAYESFMSEYLRVLARRAAKWEKFVDPDQKVKKSFKGLIYDSSSNGNTDPKP